jgi:Zn-dependent protease/CBS domain-containing protein
MVFFEGIKRQFVLMHVSGIPVRADMRWIFVIVLMSAIISASLAPFVLNTIGSAIFGLATTLVFFASIFLHEYAHAIVAKMEGLSVVEIVLHPFGGLTRFRHEPETPRAEFRVAIAGPAASFVLAVLFALLATGATSLELDILVIIAATLAVGNFLLAVFNLFPGYPLDGGRVLRAYLWRSGKDLSEATILTGRCGQVIAAIMMVFGLFVALLRGDFFTGFWAMLVGIFLWDSASGIIRDVRRQEHTAVEEAMMLPVTLKPEMSVHDLVDKILPMHRQGAFAVSREKQLLGVLLLSDMKAVPRDKWREKKVGDVMRPVAGDHFVSVGTSLAHAREAARSNEVGSVYVIDTAGDLVGVVSGNSTRRP